ncbi:hypothetical protein MMU07_09075 [Aquiflexum sp. LQ15W]|uniref:hypothetical protein n=1 Tax=Cognataquiflexum nitidum TaxID=2922272 RepID=UPI001F12C724|nr:hypothetical protein [Cognataquiflexum nitidum]MCH6199731.1 hypothetical protein [Cognataquiflexum nitidum]
MKNHTNITSKELNRDNRNLFIPLDDQHIPYVPLEEMTCYSAEAKEIFRRNREKRNAESEE